MLCGKRHRDVLGLGKRCLTRVLVSKVYAQLDFEKFLNFKFSKNKFADIAEGNMANFNQDYAYRLLSNVNLSLSYVIIEKQVIRKKAG